MIDSLGIGIRVTECGLGNRIMYAFVVLCVCCVMCVGLQIQTHTQNHGKSMHYPISQTTRFRIMSF